MLRRHSSRIAAFVVVLSVLLLGITGAYAGPSPTQIPISENQIISSSPGHAAKDSREPCEVLTYHGGPSVTWTLSGSEGYDLYNTRMTVPLISPESPACTLMVSRILVHGAFTEGTPGLRVYLWDDDGGGLPGPLLDSADIPFDQLPPDMNWVSVDWLAQGKTWIFPGGHEFHIGVTALQSDVNDVVYIVSDDGFGPYNGELRSSLHDGLGFIRTVDAAVFDYVFCIESDMCCEDPLECFATGDVNNDGVSLTVADMVDLTRFLYEGTPVPDSLHQADLNGDCVVNQDDLDLYECYFDFGFGCFPQYPIQTCCDPAVEFITECFADGDVDENGTVDEADLLLLSRILNGTTEPPYFIYHADVTGDCVVNWRDHRALTCVVFGACDAPVVLPATTCCFPPVEVNPDICYGTGNVNADASGDVNIADIVMLTEVLFTGGGPLPAPYEADVNGDCVVDTFDLNVLLCGTFVGETWPDCLEADMFPVPTCCNPTIHRPGDAVPFADEEVLKLGDATVTVFEDSIRVDNVGSGDRNGVRIVPTVSTGEIAFTLNNADLSSENAAISFQSTGYTGTEKVPGWAPEVIAIAGVTNVGGSYQISGDFNPVGDSTVHIEIYNQVGTLLDTSTVAGGGMIAIANDAGFGLPNLNFISLLTSTPLTFRIQFDGPLDFTVGGGSPVTGTEIRLVANNATKSVGDIETFDVTGQYMGYFAISNFEHGDCCRGLTGNVNYDLVDVVDISDLTALVNHLFVTFDTLACPAEANTTGDTSGDVDISDLTKLVNYLFVTFEALAACP